ASLVPGGLDTPDVPRSGMPMTDRSRGPCNLGRNAGVADQEDRLGQGPPAALGRRRPGGRVVAGGLARCAVTGRPDAEVEGLGGRVCAATDVLAGTTGAHALPTTQSQAMR